MNEEKGMVGAYTTQNDKQIVEQEVARLVEAMRDKFNEVKEDDIDGSIRALLWIQKEIVLTTILELKPRYNNLYRVNVLRELSKFVKNIVDNVTKLKEYEYKEEIDTTHPKIGILFNWFIEVLTETTEEMGMDKQIRKQFFDLLSGKFDDWEAKANKRLKGVSLKKITQDGIPNPFKKTEE